MANQITHIVFAQRAYEKHFAHLNKKDFFVGTVFPDIRIAAGIKRSVTHLACPSLQTVIDETNSFKAGLLFHNLVDNTREAFVADQGLYNKYPESQQVIRPFKTLEDEQFYDRLNIWPEVIKYFEDILPEELEFTATEEQVRDWHATLQRYFSQKPSEEWDANFLRRIGFEEEAINQFLEMLRQLRGDPFAIQLTEHMWEQLDDIILNDSARNLGE
jgi:hypothetical protein